jgi:mRNA interferase RelE/StbE
MVWRIEFSETADKQFGKLGKPAQQRISQYLETRVCKEPYAFGDDLKGNFAGLRRYRIGDYRVVCEIQDKEIKVLVVTVGHRSKIYGGH